MAKRSFKFIDTLRLYLTAGNGGNGLPKYGGIGGRGGDIVFQADGNIPNLLKLASNYPSRHVIAQHGEESHKFKLFGKEAPQTLVKCPVGVTVVDNLGNVLADFDQHNQKALVAVGGEGGNSSNQFFGQKGQTKSVIVDLKLLADIGLVGFPNAGKSTFLKAISRASPKIGKYPFTTLSPNIGVLEYDDYRQISVADLPGLIEGAHKNVGLGHKFLKHILRTKLILFLVDINGFQLRPDWPFRNALDTLLLLTKEITLYDKSILAKPAALVISKMDTPESFVKYEKFLYDLKLLVEGQNDHLSSEIIHRNIIHFDDIIPISSYNSYNILYLRNRIRDLIDYYYFEALQDKIPPSFLSIIEREQNAKITDLLLV